MSKDQQHSAHGHAPGGDVAGAPASPLDPGAAPGAPAGLPLDEEPEQHVPGSFLSALPQFFVFPLILVITLTAAYFGLRLLVGFEPSNVHELIADVRGAAGPHARWQSLHSLAEGLRRGSLSLDSVPAGELVGLYRDYAAESPQARQYLLAVLQWKRTPESTAIAIEALGDPDPDVRLSALYALAQLKDPAALPALAGALQGGSSEERFVALGGLALLGTPAARDTIATLLGGAAPELHRNAVLALAGARDARAAPFLPALLQRSSYAADPSLEGPDASQLDPASRAAARADVEEQFLVNAARAAGRLGDRSLVPLLELLRANDPSVKVRSAAINALHDLQADVPTPDPP